MGQICDILGKTMTDFVVLDKSDDSYTIQVHYFYNGEHLLNGEREDSFFGVNCFALDENLFEYSHSFIAKAKNKQGQTIGGVMFDINTDKSVYLLEIDVDESFQRKGIGTKLLDFVEYIAQDFGATIIKGLRRKNNPNNIFFYQKNGYKMQDSNDSSSIEKQLNNKRAFDNFEIANVHKVSPIDINQINTSGEEKCQNC